MTAPVPFRWIVHGLVVAAGLGTLVLHAQAPARPAGGALITGGTSVLGSKDLSVARRRFEPGARSYWHSHDNGQLLFVEDGRMWTQRRGQARRELGPGESEYAGPDVVHWHGATRRAHVIQVNVGFGGATKWLDEVTDGEYGSDGRRLMDPAIAFLKDLVAIDSVNPSLVPGAAGEAAVARALARHMEAMGLAVHVQEVAPGRPNVVGVLEGRAPGRSLMFCGHTDTVGVTGVARPFDPVERDGRLYGRGSQDMKSGVAAMVDAARVIRDTGGLDRGQLILACVVDEEHASIGADALVTRWRADGAVVTEPTDLAIAVAHKGFEWVEIETEGVAAHGSRPRDGRDAIRLMGRVLTALDALDHDLQSRPPHPLLGTASLHASLIHGGRELSSYPDRCDLQMERRTIPGEPPGCAAREVAGILERLSAADPAFRSASRPMFSRSPYEIAGDHPLVLAMQSAVAPLRPASSVSSVEPADHASATSPRPSSAASLTGMSFWTDASVLGDAGIPSLLFGPTGAGLHGVEEWVDVASVLACRDALTRLARRWTSGD